LAVSIKIKLSKKLYLRDPESSELGRNIVSNSVKLIDQLGFEAFTFKKLATEIHSTEASIYRYFENKHKLLVYLISWYWAWLEYMIDYQTMNIHHHEEKLKIIIRIISESNKQDPNFEHINETLLHNIVVAESSKAYLTKHVDEENKDGFFANYKSLCNKISTSILKVNPEYPYPNSLASNLIETAQEQIFFAKHLPSLTDIKIKGEDYSAIAHFLEHLAFGLLKHNPD
jgi:AcrR family transcriptional regulator